MSSDSPARASSCAMAAPASFPERMKGQRIRVFLRHYDCVLKTKDRVLKAMPGSLVELEVERKLLPDLSVGEYIVLEGHGGRYDCSVDALVEVPEKQLLIGVRALVRHVRPCSACWGMSASTYKDFWVSFKEKKKDSLVGIGMRFYRSGRGTVHEAVVQDLVRQGSLLDGVHLKFLSAPPPLHMGDRLVLETMDGQCQWEADVKCHGDLMFFKGSDDQRYLESVIVSVDDGKGSKLLREFKQILVFPVPSSTSPSTNNMRVTNLQGTNKARPNEAHNRAKTKIKIGIKGDTAKTGDAAKIKIKIGINGYGSIARTMIKIALDSKDLELVAINDPLASVDKTTCMFRYNNPHQGWRSDFKMKDPNTLMFDEKEVTLFRISELDKNKIPWNKTGAEYVVQALNYDYDTDYKKVCTSNYSHYSPNANPHKNCLSPLAKVLHDMFGTVKVLEDVSTSVRIHIKVESKSAGAAVAKVLPQWKGRQCGLIFKVPTVDAPPVNIGIELAESEHGMLLLSNTRPSDVFNVLLGWSVEMARQIPEVMYCKLSFM